MNEEVGLACENVNGGNDTTDKNRQHAAKHKHVERLHQIKYNYMVGEKNVLNAFVFILHIPINLVVENQF